MAPSAFSVLTPQNCQLFATLQKEYFFILSILSILTMYCFTITLRLGQNDCHVAEDIFGVHFISWTPGRFEINLGDFYQGYF